MVGQIFPVRDNFADTHKSLSLFKEPIKEGEEEYMIALRGVVSCASVLLDCFSGPLTRDCCKFLLILK